MNETDVDTFLYHNSLDNSQYQQRIARVSKRSNKKSLEIKWFEFCDLKTQQRFIFQEEVIFSEKNSVLGSTVRAIFSKLFIKQEYEYRFPYRSQKLTLDLQS